MSKEDSSFKACSGVGLCPRVGPDLLEERPLSDEPSAEVALLRAVLRESGVENVALSLRRVERMVAWREVAALRVGVGFASSKLDARSVAASPLHLRRPQHPQRVVALDQLRLHVRARLGQVARQSVACESRLFARGHRSRGVGAEQVEAFARAAIRVVVGLSDVLANATTTASTERAEQEAELSDERATSRQAAAKQVLCWVEADAVGLAACTLLVASSIISAAATTATARMFAAMTPLQVRGCTGKRERGRRGEQAKQSKRRRASATVPLRALTWTALDPDGSTR